MIKSFFILNFFLMLFSFYVWELAQFIVLLKIYKHKKGSNNQGVLFPRIGIIELARGLLFLFLFGVISHVILLGLNRTIGYIMLLYPVFLSVIASRITLEEVEGLKRITRLSSWASLYNTSIRDKAKERLLFLWPRLIYYISTGIIIAAGLVLIIYNKFLRPSS